MKSRSPWQTAPHIFQESGREKQTVRALGDLFQLLGPDPDRNIRTIVRQTCKLLNSDCSLYNRLDTRKSTPVCFSGHRLPPDFPLQEIADGQVCFEAVMHSGSRPIAIADVSKTPHRQSDPDIARYGLKSYLGCPVINAGKTIAALCVMNTRPHSFDDFEIETVSALAGILALEERRLAAETAVQQNEKWYRNLYCNTPVMLFSIDREDRLASINNHWLDTMGFQRDEVIGRRFSDFLSPVSRQTALEKMLPQFHKSGRISNHTCQLITRGGGIKEVLLSALAERDTQGSYLGAMAFMVDLTDVTLADKQNTQLSLRLRQAQKMESIATLAGGIAHQFNNALAVILGNLELIQMDGLADKTLQRFIAPIDQAGHRMVQLTSQLLAFARGGKFQTQILPAHTLVSNTLQLVSHSIAANVELETELDEHTDSIEVDQAQMQMLLAAILANASEAIQDHGQIRIALHNTLVTEQECARYQGLRPGRMVRLQIADTGKGMDEDTRARIFEPFFTTKFTGRGLGMAAVYGIVKKHNGYIYVDSIINQGTTVTVFLPCATAPTPVTEALSPCTGLRTETALIIEDEALVMDVSRAIIEKLGYRVLAAETGKAAVDLALNHPGPIDFALLDIILPDMSGNQIYPVLKKARPDLKVIVCTGFAQDGPAQEILNAGADSFVQKPFTASELATALKRLFDTGPTQGRR